MKLKIVDMILKNEKIIMLFVIIVILISGYIGLVGTSVKNSVSKCKNITDNLRKDECYYNLATNATDLALCDKIINQNTSYHCYSSIAEKRGDISICNDIDSGYWKDRCYWRVGQKLNDTTICDKITTIDYIKRIDFKNDCYIAIAKKTTNDALCEKIVASPIPYTSKDYCYQEVAWWVRGLGDENKSLVICERIDDPNIKSECVAGRDK